MAEQTEYYTLEALSRESGIEVRTIRLYIDRGLIPRAPRSGPGAHYPHATLLRLKLLAKWRTQGRVPLEVMRSALAGIGDDQLQSAVENDEHRFIAVGVGPAPEPPDAHDLLERATALLEQLAGQRPTFPPSGGQAWIRIGSPDMEIAIHVPESTERRDAVGQLAAQLRHLLERS